MGKDINYYARLGLPFDATAEEIRRAYREAALRYHPDRNVAEGETELFIGIQEAYEVISDPEKRARYDSSLPEDARSSVPVTVSALYSRAHLIQSQEPQLIYALLEVRTEAEAEKHTTIPLNLGLAIDCSTSMHGQYLDTVKSTAIELIKQLRPSDTLSLISFSDKAEVVVPSSKRMDRDFAITSVYMLSSGGGTEIYKGLQAAFNEVSFNYSRGAISHIILLTDGNTYGDERACLKLAEQAKEDCIGISTIGIGTKWNDVFLDSLAGRTGGTSVFVSQPSEIRQFLKERVYDLGKYYADQAALTLIAESDVEIKYAFRLQPDSAPLPLDFPIQLGGLLTEPPLSVLLELLVKSAPTEIANYPLAAGSLTLNIPTRKTPYYGMRIKLARGVTSHPDSQLPPSAIVQGLSRLTLYRMQEQARLEAASGNIKEATRRLQFLATNLLARGQNDLARTAMQEVARLEANNGISEEGNKRIKYGTRALFLDEIESPERSDQGDEPSNQADGGGR